MEQRPIDANALRERLLVLRYNITNIKSGPDIQCIKDIFDICLTEVSNAPTVEVKTIADCIIAYGDGHETAKRLYERPQGEWEEYACSDERGCSLCGYMSRFYFEQHFCPNCGAKMKGGAE